MSHAEVRHRHVVCLKRGMQQCPRSSEAAAVKEQESAKEKCRWLPFYSECWRGICCVNSRLHAGRSKSVEVDDIFGTGFKRCIKLVLCFPLMPNILTLFHRIFVGEIATRPRSRALLLTSQKGRFPQPQTRGARAKCLNGQSSEES